MTLEWIDPPKEIATLERVTRSDTATPENGQPSSETSFSRTMDSSAVPHERKHRMAHDPHRKPIPHRPLRPRTKGGLSAALDDEILTKIKRNYAHIWTHIIGEDPPEIFKTTTRRTNDDW